MTSRFMRIACMLLSLCALFSACSAPQDEGPTQPPVTTTEPQEPAADLPEPQADVFSLPFNENGTLNPTADVDSINARLLPLLYDTLFRLDGDFAATPVLVESYTSNGAIYNFTLKSGIRFSDGTPLTAGDAVYTLNALRASPVYRGRLEKVISVTQKSELTFTVTVSEINYLLPMLLDVPVIKAPEQDEDAAGDPVGTGRYVLERRESGCILLPNRAWRQGSPGSRAIKLVPVVDGEGMTHLFDSDIVDAMVMETGSNLEINLSGGYTAETAVTNRLTYVGINTRNPVLAMPEVRAAISLGVNRPKIIDDVINGSGYLAYMPVNPAWELYDLTAVTTSYSAAAARAALTDLGLHRDDAGSPVFPDPSWQPPEPDPDDTDNPGDADTTAPEPDSEPGDELDDEPAPTVSAHFDILVNSSNFTRVTVAQYLKDNLEALGLSATVVDVPFDEYQLKIQTGDYDLYVGEVRIPGDMDIDFLVASGGSLNYGEFSSPELDDALRAMRTAEHGDDRAAAVLRVQELLIRDTPVISLYYSVASRLLRPDVVSSSPPTVTDLYAGIELWRRRQ